MYIYLGFGFPVLTTQLLTAPPCVLAGALVLICGILADRGNRRAIMVTVGSMTVAFGYILLLVLQNRWGKNKKNPNMLSCPP